MNTKDIKKNPIIKTLHTTLACLVASSALALDDRFEDPQPQDDPEPPKRPDLVPLGVKLAHDPEYDDWDPVLFEYALSFRHFLVTATVGNFGDADAMNMEGKLISTFNCFVGYKVLATTDPVNYPVGYSTYNGLGSLEKLKVLEITDVDTYLSIPKVVTAVEVFVIMDRPLDDLWFTPAGIPGTWEDDFGPDYFGDVGESDESNNVLGGKIIYFPEYLLPTVELPVQKSLLKVRGK